MKLGVRVSDIYKTAHIQIDVEEPTKENILEAIEANYGEIKKQIAGVMGGAVVVCKPTLGEYYGPEVARGRILYFGIPAGHRIDLELKK